LLCFAFGLLQRSLVDGGIVNGIERLPTAEVVHVGNKERAKIEDVAELRCGVADHSMFSINT